MAAQPDGVPNDAHAAPTTAAATAAAAAADDDDFGLSSTTTPEDDLDHESRPSFDDSEHASPSQLPPKRKGGRKPVYATVEERKQRNRQAQAAFRERRTEYIKQLEHTLKQNQQLLQTAQNDQHAVAHECSALRYKITTLERIMSEKGIDVEAEIRAQGDTPSSHMSAYSSGDKAEPPNPLPLPPGNGAEFQSRHGFRGLAPKLDLRGKMAQLQPMATSAAVDAPTSRAHLQSPSQGQAPVHGHGQSQGPLWQPPSPEDQIQTSPAAAHFRGAPSPLYDLQGQAFNGHKDYGHQSVDYEGRHVGPGVLPSPSFHDSVSAQAQVHARNHSQSDGYTGLNGFNMPSHMNGLGKMGNFDFYPTSSS